MCVCVYMCVCYGVHNMDIQTTQSLVLSLSTVAIYISNI